MSRSKRIGLDELNMGISSIAPIGISKMEAATLLGVSEPKLNEIIAQGDFPCCKFGGKIIVSYEGLRYWMLKQVGYEDKIAIN